ncbi:hypothetical protein B0H10DRAFT_1315767 [Mycena sp. CBHHK59/15]|nr:hypothetical protein B0H10DRAFT_1315767 [Mycena sp. CBHHK59/15]
MVHIHKLRKMEQQAIESARDDEQSQEPSGSASEQQQEEAEPSTSKSAESAEPPVAPSGRPLTRSLTGRASKPRARDDSWYEPPKKNAAGRKKGGKAPRKRPISDVEPDDEPEPEADAVPPLASTQAVFVDASGDPLSAAQGAAEPRPVGRQRTSLPVPVPNLIKKSRGRRVPVRTGPTDVEEALAKRIHVCRVEGCGKCFHRGEHLKRHIRSIHTHEKPFPCTYPSCHKFFNRHDNLLQHVKVHRNDDGEADAEGSPEDDDSRSSSPTHNGFSAATHNTLNDMTAATHTGFAYPPLPMLYPPAVVYATTGMTVSSLRTEVSALRTESVSDLRTEMPETPAQGEEGSGVQHYGDEQRQSEGGVGQHQSEQRQPEGGEHYHEAQHHPNVGQQQQYPETQQHQPEADAAYYSTAAANVEMAPPPTQEQYALVDAQAGDIDGAQVAGGLAGTQEFVDPQPASMIVGTQELIDPQSSHALADPHPTTLPALLEAPHPVAEQQPPPLQIEAQTPLPYPLAQQPQAYYRLRTPPHMRTQDWTATF